MKRVAIIDDESLHATYYVAAIQSKGYECEHFKSPASLLSALNCGSAFDCYVTDLMMPARGAFTLEASENGMLSGLLLTHELRTRNDSTPIIILSNINIDGVIGRVKDGIREAPNVAFVSKAMFKPDNLADAVVGLLETGKPIEERGRLLRSLFASLLLRPNFFGFGIDLMKLLPKSWVGDE
jgi:CheY-like chemotaxis protein